MPIYKNQLPICGNYTGENHSLFRIKIRRKKERPQYSCNLPDLSRWKSPPAKRNTLPKASAPASSVYEGPAQDWFSRDCNSLVFRVASFAVCRQIVSEA